MHAFLKKRSPLLFYVIVLVVVFLLHLSYLNNGFTWLDHGDIEEGRSIVLLDQFTHAFYIQFGETGFYRPLVTLLTSTDYAVYKTFAPGYHLTNVLLHVLVVAAVPLFLSAFFVFTLPEMLLAMFIVGIHPLTWLPVGAISYRPELLLTLFIFLTIYFHAKARLTEKERFKFLAVVSFLLALFSKETALVIIPALIIFWELLHKKKPAWGLYLSEFIIVCLYFMLRMRAVPEVWKASHVPMSFADEIGTRLLVVWHLFLDFLSPFIPPLSDAVSVISVFQPLPLITLLVMGILIFSIVKTGIKSQWGKAAGLFLLLLTPALNIIAVPRIGSPHYGYLPLVIFAAMIIVIAKRFKLGYGLITCWIVVMGITTFGGGFRFQNDKTLFQPEVTKSPEFLEGHMYLGTYYLQNKEYESAENEYLLALRTNPDSLAYTEKGTVLINLGAVYMQQNELDKAKQTLLQAAPLTQSKNDQALYHNLMLVAYKQHDYKSVVELSQDNRAFPYSPIIYIVLADSLHHLGRDSEAVPLLKNLLPLVDKKQQQSIQQMIKSITK